MKDSRIVLGRQIDMLLFLFCLSLVVPLLDGKRASATAAPEASSTLLRMHRFYMTHPPHDDCLYKVLAVPPNATLAAIQKAYKQKNRQFHPDKYRHRQSQIMTEEEREERLQQVREAYDVLKEDRTRLLYHQYGLLDTNAAAFILTGGRHVSAKSNNHHQTSPEQERLLQWMGYNSDCTYKYSHQQRVYFLAASLLERIRPVVEGAMFESDLADVIANECDALKRVPLGAQILRCIGRAYRHSGQRFLRKHERRRQTKATRTTPLVRPIHVGAAQLSDVMRDKLRNAKHVLTAAVASGRVVWTEQRTKQRTSNKKKDQDLSLLGIDYHMDSAALSRIDQLIGEDDVHDLDSHLETNEEIREAERQKAQMALLESLQVEALWKITKIDLDRTVQEACNLILSGEYFFFPSHQSVRTNNWQGQGANDGWVGSTGKVVHADIGRLRAAAALVMVGDIMVQRSKEGTAWRE